MIIVSGFESVSVESLTSLGGILSYPDGFFGFSDVRYYTISASVACWNSKFVFMSFICSLIRSILG